MVAGKLSLEGQLFDFLVDAQVNTSATIAVFGHS
jgi:hypothetical protein